MRSNFFGEGIPGMIRLKRFLFNKSLTLMLQSQHFRNIAQTENCETVNGKQ
jgi:hypothetical protein